MMHPRLSAAAVLFSAAALVSAAALAGTLSASLLAPSLRAAEISADDLKKIETFVIVYAENRSFDNLFGNFPGADGLANVTPDMARQTDRDGSVLSKLPPIWEGLTGKGAVPAIDRISNRASSQCALRNRRSQRLQPADLGHDPRSRSSLLSKPDADRRRQERSLRRLWRFRRPRHGPLRRIENCSSGRSRKRYTLADNFFMGGFGGSFLNHFMLICACAPYYPDADKSPAKRLDRRRGSRWRSPEARGQFAEIGARRHADIRKGRQSHAGFLCRQYDAAALSAESRSARIGRRSSLCRSQQSRRLCRRRRRRRSAIS